MIALASILFLSISFSSFGHSESLEKAPSDGTRFFNRIKNTQDGFDILGLVFQSPFESATWPSSIPIDPRPLPSGLSAGEISITFIGHATFLIQTPKANILTDPIFSERASPFSFAGPKRVTQPGHSLGSLPRIDYILISHDHYDHLDRTTLSDLQKKQPGFEPTILIGLGSADLLKEWGFKKVVEMDWNDSHTSPTGIEFHFLEARHRSGRGLFDAFQRLWGSFLFKAEGKTVYFAGDTGYGPQFKEARSKFGDMDVSIIPIGAYEPYDFMQQVHLRPKAAIQAHNDLGSQHSIAAHFRTFQLTFEPVDDQKSY